MADIELVIKIPEWKYKYICEGIEASKRCGVVGIDHNIHEAIYNGTPLPKGHGNLIERNKVFNALHCFYAHDALDIVCNLPVIIESDKEERR